MGKRLGFPALPLCIWRRAFGLPAPVSKERWQVRAVRPQGGPACVVSFPQQLSQAALSCSQIRCCLWRLKAAWMRPRLCSSLPRTPRVSGAQGPPPRPPLLVPGVPGPPPPGPSLVLVEMSRTGSEGQGAWLQRPIARGKQGKALPLDSALLLTSSQCWGDSSTFGASVHSPVKAR